MRPASPRAPRRRSIRFRLTVWYASALAGLLLLLGLAVYGLLAGGLRRDAEQQLAARAAQIAATLNSDGAGLNFQESPTPGERVLIYDVQGQLLDANSPGYAPPRLPSWATTAMDPPGPTLRALPDGPWLLSVTVLPAGEGSLAGGRLVVGRAYGPVAALLDKTALAFLGAGPLGILLASLLGNYVAGRALAPVAAMTRAARHIQAASLESRLPVEERQDELTELAATFNALLARLEAAFGRERRFTADAAHELRAPLAVVQAETSLALVRPRTTAEYRRVLRVVDGESARLGRLIADLLTLARGDEAAPPHSGQPLLLAPLCRAVLDQVRPLARAKDVALHADLTEQIAVCGEPTGLTQLVGNLLDNGLKYTAPGGRVTLQVRQDGADAAIVVEDTGVGMAAADLPHIFDRFYRVDKARRRDDAAGGVGLGLAICARVVQAHAGTIQVASAPGAGARFTVRLPLAGASRPEAGAGAPAAG